MFTVLVFRVRSDNIKRRFGYYNTSHLHVFSRIMMMAPSAKNNTTNAEKDDGNCKSGFRVIASNALINLVRSLPRCETRRAWGLGGAVALDLERVSLDKIEIR